LNRALHAISLGLCCRGSQTTKQKMGRPNNQQRMGKNMIG
jgi:hypothetical protein